MNYNPDARPSNPSANVDSPEYTLRDGSRIVFPLNTTLVTDMNFLFHHASSFNGDISNWDVSSVTNMSAMSAYASSFNGDISNWNVSSVTDMYAMFYYASSFNGDISNWDVSSVTNMRYMFYVASSFNQNLCNWGERINFSNTFFVNMFFLSGCSKTNDPTGPNGPFCAGC